MERLTTDLIGTWDKRQRGVDLERVEQVNKICELVYAELSPGDFIFFNCNLLDKSSQNLSEARWWSLICAYNMQENKLVWRR